MLARMGRKRQVSAYDDSCRPRATADREGRLIVRSAVTSLSTFRHTTRTRVFTMTIHRRLIEQNLRSYLPLRHFPFSSARCRAVIARSLSNRTCLRYDGKATASNRDCS
ncbi:hypothetical protein TNCV_2381811 [Trichonephila clavipes]|nr:hypothetical protein TNCV_2381811 [Trichonephila clavipes]